jgi:hypothetical protein
MYRRLWFLFLYVLAFLHLSHVLSNLVSKTFRNPTIEDPLHKIRVP